MASTLKVALAGAGAFGLKHLDALSRSWDRGGVVVGRELDNNRAAAASMASATSRPIYPRPSTPGARLGHSRDPDAFARGPGAACMRAGKHVQVEIPLADRWPDAEAVVAACRRDRARLHGRPHAAIQSRASVRPPAHPYGRFHIQQMDVQTYFFRRTNMNVLGQARSWTDHLLWHHAAHTVDLFGYQCRSRDCQGATRCKDPIHPTLGIAMDMSIQLKARERRDLHIVAVVQQRRAARHVLPLYRRSRRPTSPATTISSTARTRRSMSHRSTCRMNGIELQDREFFAAIREGREPNASVAQVLPVLPRAGRLEKRMG